MPGLVDISIDEQQYQELVQALGENQARRAALRALNKTISIGNTQIKKRVKATLNLKPAAINGVISIHRANYNDLRAWITISRRLVPLYDFKGTTYSKRRGAAVQMRLDKPRAIFRHAFKAQMKSGHIGVFGRNKGMDAKGKLTKKGYARRLPIKELFGPSVLDLFGEEATTQLAQEELEKLQATLDRKLAEQVELFMSAKTQDATEI